MDIRKREFIKMSAMAASAAAVGLLLPGRGMAVESAAAGSSGTRERASRRDPAATGFQAVDMEECQSLDHREMAARSPMIQAAWNTIHAEIAGIRNTALRSLVTEIYAETTPRLAIMDGAHRAEVWKALRDAGYTNQGERDFLPPVPDDMAVRYPSMAAPGSGYGSHHAYPGGLITHVATNVRITAAIVDTYRDIYGYDVDRDIAMAAQLLHDLHKPYVFQWLEDGSSRTEQPLAGTGEHHVLSLAELLVRDAPAELVVAQACAHTHPGNDVEEAQVVGWLRAAACIAGRDPKEYGLLEKDGKTVPLPRRQEGFLCHLGDHDFVLSVPAVGWTVPVMRTIARRDYALSDADVGGKAFNALRNMVFSHASAMRLHHAMVQGEEEVRALMFSVVRPS